MRVLQFIAGCLFILIVVVAMIGFFIRKFKEYRYVRHIK